MLWYSRALETPTRLETLGQISEEICDNPTCRQPFQSKSAGFHNLGNGRVIFPAKDFVAVAVQQSLGNFFTVLNSSWQHFSH